MELKLSVLDQLPIPKGQPTREALLASLELAKLADSLGYHRFWFAEHHNTRDLASVAPELLISHTAAQTSQIRVGSGGVLLSHYSPYKVAENFRLLEGLYPNRIDLGTGRAPGGDARIAQALANGAVRSPSEYPKQVQELLSFLSNGQTVSSPSQELRAYPQIESTPEVWLLGSSGSSAALAAQTGTAFSFAHFISPEIGPKAMQAYREHFQPSKGLSKPQTSVCTYVVCAETDEKAQKEALSLEYWLIQLANGTSDGIPSVEEAKGFSWSWEQEAWNQNRRKMIVGSPETVKAGIEYMAEDYGTDEIMILTNVHNFEARKTSYRLLMEAFQADPVVTKTLQENEG